MCVKSISPSWIQLMQPIFFKFSTTELLKSINFHIEGSKHTCHLNNSQFYSILACESGEIRSNEELAICGR